MIVGMPDGVADVDVPDREVRRARVVHRALDGQDRGHRDEEDDGDERREPVAAEGGEDFDPGRRGLRSVARQAEPFGRTGHEAGAGR